MSIDYAAVDRYLETQGQYKILCTTSNIVKIFAKNAKWFALFALPSSAVFVWLYI